MKIDINKLGLLGAFFTIAFSSAVYAQGPGYGQGPMGQGNGHMMGRGHMMGPGQGPMMGQPGKGGDRLGYRLFNTLNLDEAQTKKIYDILNNKKEDLVKLRDEKIELDKKFYELFGKEDTKKEALVSAQKEIWKIQEKMHEVQSKYMLDIWELLNHEQREEFSKALDRKWNYRGHHRFGRGGMYGVPGN